MCNSLGWINPSRVPPAPLLLGLQELWLDQFEALGRMAQVALSTLGAASWLNIDLDSSRVLAPEPTFLQRFHAMNAAFRA